MKRCPFCAEEIQDTAIVCRHCRRDLNVTMGDYKTDQDRLFDALRDREQLAKAVERQQQEAQLADIDRVAQQLVRVGPWTTMASARALVIRKWREQGKLPADFPAPDGPGDGDDGD